MKPVVPLTSGTGVTESAGAVAAEARLLELLERYGRLLRRTIARFCPGQLGLSIDDIEQEARVRLWRALQGERPIGYPASYIYRVAVSATLEAIRRARARREHPLGDPHDDADVEPAQVLTAGPEASPEAIAERTEWMRMVEGALGRLQENRRLAVGLHLQGMTTTEIGSLLGWSEPKARNLVHRGLKDLRKLLRSEGLEYGA